MPINVPSITVDATVLYHLQIFHTTYSMGIDIFYAIQILDMYGHILYMVQCLALKATLATV